MQLLGTLDGMETVVKQDNGATTVVLSQGMNMQLHVHPDTYRYLDERSITVHVAETRQAVRIYNDLRHAACRAFPLDLLTSAPTREHADSGN